MSGTNPFFQEHLWSGEQSLVEDLLIEAIQIHGLDVYYIARDSATGFIDPLYGEDVLSKFTRAYPIEMYVDRADGFDGSGELMSKFGIVINNQVDWVVSIRRFNEATQNQFIRPREGDLIYFPLKPAVFEIKYVADKTEFYQLQKLFFYKLSTEIFKFGEEDMQTGIQDIDDFGRTTGYELAFTLGAGSGNYVVGETVSANGASARVSSWNAPIKMLNVIDIVGPFSTNTTITGTTSNAAYTLVSYDDLVNLNIPEMINRPVSNSANTIIDFSEQNPFSQSNP